MTAVTKMPSPKGMKIIDSGRIAERSTYNSAAGMDAVPIAT